MLFASVLSVDLVILFAVVVDYTLQTVGRIVKTGIFNELCQNRLGGK